MDDSKVGKFDQLVRPLVTLALTAGFIWGFIQNRIDTQNFVPVVIMALGFWFGSRATAAVTPSKTTTTETTPSGAKREVTQTAPPGAAPPAPPEPPPPTSKGATP